MLRKESNGIMSGRKEMKTKTGKKKHTTNRKQ